MVALRISAQSHSNHHPVADLPGNIQSLIDQGAVEFIRFEQPDTHGIARSKTVPVRHLQRFAHKGLNFPLPTFGLDVQGDTAPNTGVLEEIVYGDAYLFPDFSTFQVLPWVDKTARVLSEPRHLDGSPVALATRHLAALAASGPQRSFGCHPARVCDWSRGRWPTTKTKPTSKKNTTTMDKQQQQTMDARKHQTHLCFWYYFAFFRKK